MVHKVEVGGKTFELKHPVAVLHRKVFRLYTEMTELEKQEDTDERNQKLDATWLQAARLMFVDPVDGAVDSNNFTVGEQVELFAHFFAATQPTSVKPPIG